MLQTNVCFSQNEGLFVLRDGIRVISKGQVGCAERISDRRLDERLPFEHVVDHRLYCIQRLPDRDVVTASSLSSARSRRGQYLILKEGQDRTSFIFGFF